MENGRQDYFGRTVNVAARVQDLAVSRGIFATASVVENPQTSRLLEANNLMPVVKRTTPQGIAGEIMVYEIP